MKKLSISLILLIIMLCNINVFAKDTVISMNKYTEEKFSTVLDSYDTEGTKDGKIVGGYIAKDTDVDDVTLQQAIIVKYNKQNKIAWKYIYEKEIDTYLDALNYSYNSEGKIDGYLMTVHCAKDEDNATLIRMSLDGNVILEKDLPVDKKITITKVKEVYNEEKVIDGYIAIGNSSILKLDRELNVVWLHEYPDYKFVDVEKVTKDGKIEGYVVIKQAIDSETYELIRFNIYGEDPFTINSQLEESIKYSLAEANDGFVLYGSTNEVKLSKGDTSYYLINYNSNNENYWETIGDVSVDKEKVIRVLPIKKDNAVQEYLLLYSSSSPESNVEVVKVGIDGEIKNKIKKIYAEYYNVLDFTINNDILYLVGQIDCPKDDTCDYDSNSLYLVSDEEKVIEVGDNDSRNVLIITGVFIILIIGAIIIRKRNTLKAKNI